MRPIYLYGIKGFDSCEICDEVLTEDNPGKEVSYEINGRKFIAHVCNDCFACSDYLELMVTKKNLEIKTYPQWTNFGMK